MKENNNNWVSSKESNKAIRDLNDLLRTTFITGVVVLTDGIKSLPDSDREAIITLVREFDNFDIENDPYKEHDFGSVDHKQIKVFWKIDYYDNSGLYHSKEPSNPNLTKRVLTIMLAEEY